MAEARIENFDQAAALILARCYAAFPGWFLPDLESVAAELAPEEMLNMSFHPSSEPVFTGPGHFPNGDSALQIVVDTIDWLSSEGFLKKMNGELRLTAKCLVAMKAMPELPSVTAQAEPLGERLLGALKQAGSKAGDEAIRKTVGLVFALGAGSAG